MEGVTVGSGDGAVVEGAVAAGDGANVSLGEEDDVDEHPARSKTELASAAPPAREYAITRWLVAVMGMVSAMMVAQ